MTHTPDHPYASRAGLKLEHALRTFSLDVTGLTCADFGCNVGGFTDCLLQHGAAKVYAIDTAYGTLAWTLRNDPRVVVMERTNALHADPPRVEPGSGGGAGGGGDEDPIAIDLISIDLGWTPQRLALPAALNWLDGSGQIVTLVKPHYELSESEKRGSLVDGVLPEDEAERVLAGVLGRMPELGIEVLGHTRSPLRGGKSSRKSGSAGNIEFLVHGRPIQPI